MTKAVLVSGIISALVTAIATVSLTKFFDTVLPSSLVLKETSDDKSANGIYSFEYSSSSNGRQFLGIVTQYPIRYYSISIGNASQQESGTIHVSMDFPSRMKKIWILIGDNRGTHKNSSSIHFQMSQLPPGHGATFSIAVATLELPDVTKMNMRVTSSIGDFEKVSTSRYKSIFKPIEEKQK